MKGKTAAKALPATETIEAEIIQDCLNVESETPSQETQIEKHPIPVLSEFMDNNP